MVSHAQTLPVHPEQKLTSSRREKGYALWWARHAIGDLVLSADLTRAHRVTPRQGDRPASCDCPDFTYRGARQGFRCAHLEAARYEAAEKLGRLDRATAPAPGEGPAPVV